MNKNNYASLEVAQRLVDAGIVLETDMSWYFRNNEWILRQSGSVYEGNISIPAPCFAELWRELPETTILFNETALIFIRRDNDITYCGYSSDSGWEQRSSVNPADAIAELLIRVKG